MKTIRKISPVISVILVFLMLAGSTGFTIVKHECSLCGEEARSSLAIAISGDETCCHHDFATHSYDSGIEGFGFDNDSCTHETEKMISEDLVRSEVQPEIMSFFVAAVQISTLFINTDRDDFPNPSVEVSHRGRDLTTLHCQIIS